MKIAVTGGSGRLGSYVMTRLKADCHTVVNVDRVADKDGWCLLADLADPGQVYDAFASIRPEAVVHLAADPAPVGRPRHAQFANNVLGTMAVVQAASDLGVGRIVYASSEMASGWTRGAKPVHHLPLTETDEVLPINSYGLGKRIGETICESAAMAHPSMIVTSLRLNYVVFESDYPRLAASAAELTGGPHHLWGYLDGRDAAQAVALAAEQDQPGYHLYNVAAPDTFIDIPTSVAMARIGKPVTMRADWPEFGSPVDSSRIQRELGWKAKYLWRDQAAP